MAILIKKPLYLLSDFDGLKQVPPEKQVEHFENLPGQLRLLLKLHKPGLKVRKVEVDLRNPLSNTASWLAEILNLVSRNCASVIVDSKQIFTKTAF